MMIDHLDKIACGAAGDVNATCERDKAMGVREAAKRFARTWEAGWAVGDVGSIVGLYAEGAVHRSMPFRAVHEGRAAIEAYIRWSFGDERAVAVVFGRPMVDGDQCVVEYWVTLIENVGDKPTTLAGCAFARFGDDGLVVESRDYWHTAEGHVAPGGLGGVR